jgi:3-isopropylmalate dehydratase small subunit
MNRLEGKAWRFGDNLNTDLIMPGRYLALDIEEMSQHVFEPVRAGFAGLVTPGDIVVAGRNFGGGSSREAAPLAIQAAGIQAVIAMSFGRIFFRNCINVGLLPIECPEADSIEESQILRIEVASGSVEIVETGRVLAGIPIPDGVGEILACGGLENYLAARLSRSAGGEAAGSSR